jgi:signal peptidase I
VKRKQVDDSQQSRETTLEGFSSTCSVLAVGLFVLSFLFQNFVIPSSSMASTLLTGDHVMVERENLAPPTKWAPFVHYREVFRGDVVVFYKPTAQPNGEHIFLVKRVVGVPGDLIHLRRGVVYLNGIAQKEPWVGKPTRPYYDRRSLIGASSDAGVVRAPAAIHSRRRRSGAPEQLLCDGR